MDKTECVFLHIYVRRREDVRASVERLGWPLQGLKKTNKQKTWGRIPILLTVRAWYFLFGDETMSLKGSILGKEEKRERGSH